MGLRSRLGGLGRLALRGEVGEGGRGLGSGSFGGRLSGQIAQSAGQGGGGGRVTDLAYDTIATIY